MNSCFEDGLYTHTQAYNFLKNLLGVSKKILIKKEFFALFFNEVDGLFKIKTSEEFIQNLFQANNIATLNKEYYELKKSGEIEKAKEKWLHVVKITTAQKDAA